MERLPEAADGLRSAGTGNPLAQASGERQYAFVRDFKAEPGEHVAGPNAGPIEKAFFEGVGLRVQKWHHYLPVYDRYFAIMRDRPRERPLRLLEIGVHGGGSLQLWRRFFGDDAVIFGVDINEDCKALDGRCGGSVRVGSQDDETFLKAVVAEMGGSIDVVVDDGSHRADHVNKTFDILFPVLADGGMYFVEDLHTAYWHKFGGGRGRPGTFIDRTKQMIDDMHQHWHGEKREVAPAAGTIAALHVYDSLVVVEKSTRLARPVHSVQAEA